MGDEKSVDESWKDRAASEKSSGDMNLGEHDHQGCSCHDHAHDEEGEEEFNFLTYITSLAFQAMIFLGLIPNPLAGDVIEKNLRQAKFLIDTLLVIRDKTKGNLTKEEADLLNNSIYELELRYVEAVKAEKGGIIH